MGHFFASLPKTTIALLAIIVGFIVIVLQDPPKTVCDSQLELFKKQQTEFIYAGSEGIEGGPKRALATKLAETCKATNSPGGCFEYFMRLKRLNQDLESVSRQCSEAIADDDLLKAWILNSMKLMAQISWGDRGPASASHRNAWFDASDLSLYCGLKKNAVQIYGAEKVDEWRDGVLSSLPESEKLGRDQVLQSSLFSTSCEAYR